MNACKIVLLCVMLAWAASSVQAVDENGLSVIVQKTTLDATKDRDEFLAWDKVDKALGLKLEARNTSFADLPEGTLKFIVIVKKWDLVDQYQRHSGEEKFPALRRGESLKKVIGKIPLSGYEISGNRRQFMDTIEGYRITISHGGKQTIELSSSKDFDKVNEKAKPAR